MALDLADIALVLIPVDDGLALDVISRQIEECGSEHVAFFPRKRSQAHVLYEEPPRNVSVFTNPVIFLRYSLWRYVFGSSMESADSNITLPFDFVSPEQFEIYLDIQDSKASIRFLDGNTLLDGRALVEGVTVDLKDGAIIKIEDIMFKVLKIRSSAAAEPNTGQTEDVHGEQRHTQSLATERPVAHAETMAFLEGISKQPSDSSMRQEETLPQARLDPSAHRDPSSLLEALPKLEDYRRGALIGKGGFGQVFKHKDRRSVEVFAVKVLAFPETKCTGREDIDEKMDKLSDRKMTYINREEEILLKADHVSYRGDRK